MKGSREIQNRRRAIYLFIYVLRSILDLQLTQTELYRDTIMVSSIKGKSDKLNERRVAILN